MIGGTVYDFSLVYAAIRSNSNEDWFQRYRMNGTVTSTLNGAVTLTHTSSRWVRSVPKPVMPTSMLLHESARSRLGMSTLPLDGFAWTREEALGLSVKEESFTYVFVNCDLQLSRGTTVTIVGLPLGNRRFDYGTPISTVPPGTTVVTISAAGNLVARLPSLAEINVTESRVAAIQMRDATNGVGSAQYELGKRYIEARGVQRDAALAIKWLTASKTNGYSEAAERLVQQVRNWPR